MLGERVSDRRTQGIDETVKPHRYRFRRTWFVDAAPRDVFELLYLVPRYPGWWPEIRDVRRIDAERFSLTIHSVLPYGLEIELSRRVVDRQSGVLEAAMAGDLAGISAWRVDPEGVGARVRFAEDARVARRRLQALEPFAIPAFIANHALMMRSCERGLRAAATGMRVADGTTELPVRSRRSRASK